jgi:hypothetical protein
MKLTDIRRYAMALPEVTEEPHHQSTSFRVRGKIFVTAPPKGDYVHILINELAREQAIALYPSFIEKLFWGGKVWGVRVNLGAATPSVVNGLVHTAWATKAPKSLPSSRSSNRKT